METPLEKDSMNLLGEKKDAMMEEEGDEDEFGALSDENV